jgi:hypothetical protein
MEILDALKQEESKLHRKLMAVQGAVAALNAGSMTAVTVSPSHTSSTDGRSGRRTLSAAVRARISRKAKARWAKIRAEKAKGKKAK